MVRCPEILPEWTEYISREQFAALQGEGKVNAIINFAVDAYAKEAHKCAIRHNALVDYVEEIQ